MSGELKECGILSKGAVEKIVAQCVARGVPVFVKQLSLGGKCVTDIDKFPMHLRVRQVPWTSERRKDD